MDDVVLYEVSDGIAKITLNRPDQMNAWTGELSDELQARLGEADRDDEVVVVVITGAGKACLLYTSPSPRDRTRSRMPSSA